MKLAVVMCAAMLAACAGTKPLKYPDQSRATLPMTREQAAAKTVQWCAMNSFAVTSHSDAAVIATSTLAQFEQRKENAWTGWSNDGPLAIDCGQTPGGGRGWATKTVLTVTFSDATGGTSGCEAYAGLTVQEATWGLSQCTSTGAVESSLWTFLK